MRKIAWYLLDWKNPDSYTSIITTETPGDVCAWEFLRRNLEYQYDYFEYARTGRFPFYIPYMKKIDRTDMCDWYCIDKQSNNFDPNVNTPPIFVFDGEPTFNTRSSFPDRNLPGEFIVRLSTELGRDSQLEAVKSYFDEYQRKCKTGFTINKKNYGIYLRILDALAVGIPEEEIIDGRTDICKVEKLATAKSYIEQAKSLRDRDYIRIVGGKIYYPKPDELKFSDRVFNATGTEGALP